MSGAHRHHNTRRAARYAAERGYFSRLRDIEADRRATLDGTATLTLARPQEIAHVYLSRKALRRRVTTSAEAGA
jgi:hypothetical protein